MIKPTPRSCLVHGPAGCGKTRNAQAIAKALGLSQILDDWQAGAPVPLLDTLVLTSADNPAWYFKGRVMTFDQAMQIAHHRGSDQKAHDSPLPDADNNAAAWLGQAGLYRTRLEAAQNGEQHLEPVSANQLLELARLHIREACIHA